MFYRLLWWSFQSFEDNPSKNVCAAESAYKSESRHSLGQGGHLITSSGPPAGLWWTWGGSAQRTWGGSAQRRPASTSQPVVQSSPFYLLTVLRSICCMKVRISTPSWWVPGRSPVPNIACCLLPGCKTTNQSAIYSFLCTQLNWSWDNAGHVLAPRKVTRIKQNKWHPSTDAQNHGQYASLS